MRKRTWALIVFVYLAFAEALTWVPVPDLSECLIQPKYSEQSSGYASRKYCPGFHAALDALDGFLERHDKSVIGGFTVVLAISTIGLWLATNSLYEAGEKELALLRENAAQQSSDMQASIAAANEANQLNLRNFTSINRPRIRIKHFVLAADLAEDKPIVVNLTCVNNGITDAFLQQIGMRLFVVRNGRELPIETAIPTVFGAEKARLQTGYNHDFNGLKTEMTLNTEQYSAIQTCKAKLYCVGYVSYFDGADLLRITGFCRVLDFPKDSVARVDNSRFRKVDHPDYEYQD